MCGRYTIVSKVKTIEKRFNVKSNNTDIPFNTNVSAGDSSPIITSDNPNKLQFFEFGFTPNWYKSKKTYTINARSEGDNNKENGTNYKGTMGILTKPFFGNAIRNKRCLVIADSFIEGPNDEKLSKPYVLYLRDKKRPFAFAGVWDEWVNDETGEVSHGFAIITTYSNDLTAKIKHDRSPVILEREDELLWLDPNTPLGEITSLLKPYDALKMNGYPISSEIKNPNNNGINLLNPIGQRIYKEHDTTIEKKIVLQGMGETTARRRR